jgi:glycosyltransferase involved in cell wall biosynthesis
MVEVFFGVAGKCGSKSRMWQGRKKLGAKGMRGKKIEGRRPHLLHVIPTFAPGGVPIRISTLINHFGAEFRHSLIATNGDISCRSRLNPQIAIDFPEAAPAGGGLIRRLMAYRRKIRALQPDLLLTYQWGSVEWALANRFRPICRHVHLESGFGPEEADRQLPRRVWMRRLALGNISKLVVPSATLVKIARDEWGIPPAKIQHIPNGVDCGLYAGPPDLTILPDFTPCPGEKIIGTLTPLRAEKNLQRLIRSFAALVHERGLGNIRLMILGEGHERPALERLAQELKVAPLVLLPGHIHAPEKILGLFSVYAISSDTEQMPNAVIQAMAAGRAIAGLDVGDVKHIVSKLNRPLIAPKGDDKAFTESLYRLLHDDDLRDQVAEANRRHVRDTYDQNRMFEAYHKIWRGEL